MVALFVLVILALLVIIIAFQPKPIVLTLHDNPLRLKEKQYTILNAVITNITGEKAADVSVRAEAEDRQSIIIGTAGSDSEKITVIESGLNRKVNFLVFPKTGIKEGNYRIKVTTLINGQPFEESIVLEVLPN
ncbi:MAG: hypothetical protein NT067_06215 [Candidatus Diapherotrites archaeon]|nr:hypothetical protein [Candidatus Diapherotrites archaeon]